MFFHDDVYIFYICILLCYAVVLLMLTPYNIIIMAKYDASKEIVFKSTGLAIKKISEKYTQICCFFMLCVFVTVLAHYPALTETEIHFRGIIQHQRHFQIYQTTYTVCMLKN